jgi:hypothetical protein
MPKCRRQTTHKRRSRISGGEAADLKYLEHSASGELLAYPSTFAAALTDA